ncbi:hypothetical protein [Helicobacter pylori]|uniref:hypothetical protein n=1 Tax=Helicobacter pylori TaxID=210 RepID=UPI00165BC3FC|nr:hypothetical protein [Helicobacter pylori]MBH0256046.1 hypothetical protein [Helicobacter pylori]
MQDLQDFKNDITLILSKDRLETYDNLEQYKENLNPQAEIPNIFSVWDECH